MKVLIAEDDRHTREGLATVFRREGYEVVCAEDGEHALTLFENTAPDVVCLDVMMPRLNGYDVCRRLRRGDPDVPVIFISAKSEEIDRVLGLELGADDYISKPFGVREVVARIRAVTRRFMRSRHDEERLAEFAFGPYTVSPIDLTAVSPEQSVDLSLRDVHILRTLSGRDGQAVGRGTLYRECWGKDQPLTSRTLDQHIAKLRKRLETDPANPVLIQTVHGVGYRYCSGTTAPSSPGPQPNMPFAP